MKTISHRQSRRNSARRRWKVKARLARARRSRAARPAAPQGGRETQNAPRSGTGPPGRTITARRAPRGTPPERYGASSPDFSHP